MIAPTFFRRFAATIKHMIVGSFETNCYFLHQPNHCLVIDPGAQSKAILSRLTKDAPNLVPDIYLTHGHVDHISGVPGLCKAFPSARIFAPAPERPFFSDPTLNLSAEFGRPIDLTNLFKRVTWVKEGEKIKFGDIEFQVLITPGHTPGSSAIFSEAERYVFVGDTLFAGSVGNPDFPGGNFRTLMRSIVDKLMVLPDATVVYPGHGDSTTIGEERKSNPFLLSFRK
jgi:hydroxyacylglutathione hydrolase